MTGSRHVYLMPDVHDDLITLANQHETSGSNLIRCLVHEMKEGRIKIGTEVVKAMDPLQKRHETIFKARSIIGGVLEKLGSGRRKIGEVIVRCRPYGVGEKLVRTELACLKAVKLFDNRDEYEFNLLEWLDGKKASGG